MSGGGQKRPLYARVLRLEYVDPSGLMCFLLFEGSIALAVLLALAELVNWWGVVVLPAVVACLVKINDVVAGGYKRSEKTRRFTTRRRPGSARGIATVPAARASADGALDPEQAAGDGGVDASTEVFGKLARGGSRHRRATNQRAFTRPQGHPPR